MNFFAPPVFADEGKTLAARRLWAVLICLLATTTVLFPAAMAVIPASAGRFALQLGLYDATFLGLLALARLGRTALAAVAAIVVPGAIVTVSAWTAGGVRSPGVMAYLLLVGIAGLLRGSRAAALTGAACGAVSFLLLMAERTGRLPVPTVHHDATSVWLVLAFIMINIVVVQAVLHWAVRRAERQAIASAAEQRKTEAARRETAEKFAKVFQASPDAIVISDLETGEIIEANPSYEKLFGYTHAELIGRTTPELGIFDRPGDRQAMVAAVRAAGGIRDWEMTVRNRKGEPIPLLFSGELVDLGDRRCLVSVIHDLTGRKESEARERRTREAFTRGLIASQETERRRIAGELHDSLGQNLILIKHRAQLALDLAAPSSPLSDHLRNLLDLAGQAIAEVRQISHDLRPYQLDQLGLTRALEAMIEGAAQGSRLSIERKLDPVDDLFAPEAATHLYRVAQECLGNLLKHAGARRARIGLERDIRDVRLWIEDDGRGFVATPLPAGGLGLSGIAERVRILGGALRIASRPGGGTRIEVVVPLAELRPASPDRTG